ncbi:hypothetical protein [Novosphingobium sp.]|uniref:hypothetical protein n=1 Tax=Novosphingobium sp. TaxID=1874826 RepID=UPI003D10F429
MHETLLAKTATIVAISLESGATTGHPGLEQVELTSSKLAPLGGSVAAVTTRFSRNHLRPVQVRSYLAASVMASRVISHYSKAALD